MHLKWHVAFSTLSPRLVKTHWWPGRWSTDTFCFGPWNIKFGNRQSKHRIATLTLFMSFLLIDYQLIPYVAKKPHQKQPTKNGASYLRAIKWARLHYKNDRFWFFPKALIRRHHNAHKSHGGEWDSLSIEHGSIRASFQILIQIKVISNWDCTLNLWNI